MESPCPKTADHISATVGAQWLSQRRLPSQFLPALRWYGARLVASPRHADVVLVTGVVTRNTAEPLRRTVEATPLPRLVVAVGDCARDCGVFRGAYGVVGAVGEVVDVDLDVPGCPPEPQAIVAATRRVTGR